MKKTDKFFVAGSMAIILSILLLVMFIDVIFPVAEEDIMKLLW